MISSPFRTVFLASLLLGGCATRNYTHYLIEPAPETSTLLEEEDGTQLRPMGFGSTTAMTVRWNDGDVITEVQIPMLASGQRIVIEHTAGATDVEAIPATRLVPPAPSVASNVAQIRKSLELIPLFNPWIARTLVPALRRPTCWLTGNS